MVFNLDDLLGYNILNIFHCSQLLRVLFIPVIRTKERGKRLVLQKDDKVKPSNRPIKAVDNRVVVLALLK